MSGLSPLMNNLKMNTINEELWNDLFDLHRRLLTAIPKKKRRYWREKCEIIHSKYTQRTDA